MYLITKNKKKPPTCDTEHVQQNRKSNSCGKCVNFRYNKFNLKDKEKNIIQYKLESILGVGEGNWF